MANLEIERKFLVKGDFRPFIQSSERITQAYLNSSPDRTVRVRIAGDKAYITVKGRNHGASRFEWEKEIGIAEAEALLPLCEKGTVDKIRHIVPFCGFIWEVDEYLGDNEGLVVAEVELESENDNFPVPDWVGEEVTGEPGYYNSNLGLNPFKNWH